jgi:hypothetical protein
MTFQGKNGQTYNVFQPGYTLDLTSGTPTIRPTTAADTNSIMTAFARGGSGTGTADTSNNGDTPAPDNSLSSDTTNDMSQLVTDATVTQIQGELQEQVQNQEQPGTQPPPPPQTQTGTTPPAPVVIETVTMRVLASPGVYTAFPNSPGKTFTTDEGGEAGILGGGDYAPQPQLAADDFVWKFNIEKGRIVGTVQGLIDASCGSGPNCVVQNNAPASPAPKIDFPAVFPAAGQCNGVGICFVFDAKITQGVPTNYAGVAVVKDKGDFFAFQVMAGHWGESGLIPDDPSNPDRIMIFGGKDYGFDDPRGKLHFFQLSADITQLGAAGPFASVNSSPSGEGGLVSGTPLVMLEQDGGSEDVSRPVWLQSTFALSGEGMGQESFVNIALGEWSPEDGLTGARRGASSVNHNPDGTEGHQTYSFSGDIASLAGPDGSHFLGSTQPNIVIGADSTGSHNIFRDTPLNATGYNNTVENQSGATYHVGVGLGSTDGPLQNTGTFTGFATGFAQQSGSGSPHLLRNVTPNDVSISLDAETNTMTASLHLGDGVLQNPRYNFEFGGEGRSAFIDNDTFAAVENQQESGIQETVLVRTNGFPFVGTQTNEYNVEMQGFIVSADAIRANEVLFAGQMVRADPNNPNSALTQKRAFCQSCDFMKWGAWGVRTTHTKGNQVVTNNVPLGWWIAGNVVDPSDMPSTGSATYTGDAIGNVATQGRQYVATGKMDMKWHFNPRVGTLNIRDFDGKNFSAAMAAARATPQKFNGVMVGPGMIGAANGAFVGRDPGHAPKGVIGNFGVGNSSYQATGIFGGVR